MGNISVDYDVLNQKGSPAWYSDLFANIPTPGYKGRMFISTDTFAFYRDNGVGWDLVGGPGTGTITGAGVFGQVTFFSGTDTISGNTDFVWDNTNKRLGINTGTPGAPLDIHSTGTAAQFNGTTTNNAFVLFQNAGTSKWRIGNLYNSGANDYQIYDVLNATARLTIKNTGATTLTGTFTATSLIKSGGTSSQILLADGTTTPTSTFGAGSVTSVSAITLGTSGTDLSSSVANSTTTPVITLNVPTASATNRGALSSADWTTFNSKQSTITLTTTGTSGAATLVGATLNIPNYTNVGTVTSVAALTLGTTGTDLSSSVANSTSTPVITLNVPTASATNRGALSTTDWTTFNNKQATISVTAPVVLTGATISMPAATTSVSGYLTSTDWNTFNNKTSNLGTVTDVVALTIGTTGIDITSTAVTTTTTPVITLNIPTASASNRGALSSTDWTTFNNKQSALTNPVTGTGTTNYLPKFTGTTTIGNSILQETGGFLLTDKGISTMFGVAVATSNSNGGSLTVKAGGGFGAGNTAGNLYLAFGRGNSSASNGAMYFGLAQSTDAVGLDTTYMTLSSSGNLGLGNIPIDLYTGYKLQIGSSSDSQTFLSIGNSTTGLGPLNGLVIGNDSTGADIYQRENAPLRFHTNNTQAMTLFSDGNLALNTTTNAGYKLDVNGTGRFSDELYLIKSSTGGSTGQYPEIFVQNSNTNVTGGNVSVAATRWITLNGGTGNVSGQAAAISTASDNYLRFGTLSNHRIDFITNGNTALSLASTGAATFSSSVTATGGLISNGGSIGYGGGELGFGVTTSGATSGIYTLATGSPVLYFDHRATGNTGFWVWRSGTGGGTTALTLSNTGAATFSSSVTASDDITISKTSANLRLFITNTTATTGRSWYFNSYSNGNLYVGNTTAGDIFNFSSTGAATFSSTLGINGTSNNVRSGTYTPTVTAGTNCAAVTSYPCQYMQVDKVVTVSGYVYGSATAITTETQFTMSTPVNTNFTQVYQCGGTGRSAQGGVSPSGAGYVASISANATNEVRFSYTAPAVLGTGGYFWFSFTYQII